ncbi:MAG TPA: YhdP family protein [Casimicrobiaceae bacterium]|jgi:uncharacterized protein (TIGR02099 family)
MPFARASSRVSPAVSPLRAARLLLLIADAVLVVIGLFCALLLIVRFVVFPQVELHRADIVAALSARIGESVEIDAIDTGWDGWNPKLSIRGLRIRDRTDRSREPLLDLPRVDLIVAWTSLPLLEFRLRELVVDGPKLSIRRDAGGRLQIAGMAVDSAHQSEKAIVGDWLLRQREIVVSNALITWDDELRKAPQLVLDQVQFRLEHRFGHHRFGLTGMPPSELASPVDLRGDIVGLGPADWQNVDGHFYLQFDYADVAAWREYLSLPLPVDSGKGALRLWMELENREPRDLTADIVLADVRTQLAADLPPLALARVSGRVGWKHDGGHHELYTKALAFEAMDGTTLSATDFTFTHDEAADGRPAAGKLAFARLDLAPLTALAAHLPLPRGVRHDLARYSPRGMLNDGKYAWQGPAEAPSKFSASGAFEGLGVNAQDVFPGGSGITGRFDSTETKGTLKLASQRMTLDLPNVFVDPIALDSAAGNVRWEHTAETLQVRVDDFSFANGHAAGTASGSWKSLSTGPGAIDLKARLTRANIEHLYRYVPRNIHSNVREWMQRALLKGTSNDVRVVLNGNLADFPFAQGRNGQFVATAKAQGGLLDYAEDWPSISDIDADIRLEGTRLLVDASSGKVLGAQIARTRAEIADLHHAVLRINGEAAGPTKDFLAFIEQSPVAEWIGHFSDGAQASGNGRLALNFDLPLANPHSATVTGEYQFIGNELRIAGAPQLAQVNGKVSFGGHSLTGRDITAETLGGTVKLELSGSDGRVRVTGAGTVSLAQLRTQVDSPLVDRLSGDTDYQVTVNVRPQGATWTVESSLKGAAIDLPAPLGKTADQVVALRVERRDAALPRKDELLAIDYGTIGRLLLRRPTRDAPFDRGLLLLGKVSAQGGEPERAGFWLRADLPALDLDEWLGFGRAMTGRAAGNGATSTLDFDGADVDATSLSAFGRKFNRTNIVARRAGEEWRVALAGNDVAGTAVWRAPTASTPNGRIVARLARLTLPVAAEPLSGQSARKAARPAGAATAWPAIDLASDAFYSKDHDLGKLELAARPSGSDWQIESLTLKNDGGTISADGWWRAGEPQQTKLDVALDVNEAGTFLAPFGTADAISGAATKITGQLAWNGSPADFDYRTLNGTFQVTAGVGQFMKADPGVGRLLGVLSLQALPRRISLDFRDVFSEGFAFDSIAGSARIQDGMMSTDNLRMVGPAATVIISGTVDLARETQKLRVRVQPALSTSVSAGAAALFIANPLVGAAIGAGALLAQKVLKDPIEQLFSYDYAVTGGWSDPIVERVSSRTAAAPAIIDK